jgi:mannosylglycerate hydrolase MGH1-like protein
MMPKENPRSRSAGGGGERRRLGDPAAWRRWGPYLAERQWATVREDYSPNGDAWGSFPHDHARSRAYRWGEDGLAGISDDRQLLCLALAVWNERDPILKERAFGLTNTEGNHGEDVKEYYFFLDSTPTHSWMRWRYKYPHAAFPYGELVEENGRRGAREFEYELLDTGVFAEDRYFDVELDFAKGDPDDMLVTIRATNRGPDPAPLHLLPTLWFRNTWSSDGGERPRIEASGSSLVAEHPELGEVFLHVDAEPELLFTENETNAERLWGVANATPYVKDAFHAYVVDGRTDAVNPERVGSKAAAHLQATVAPGATWTIRLRLTASRREDAFTDFDAVAAARREEADEFYGELTPPALSDDAKLVMRQALAGMLWSKQFYLYDVATWLREHGGEAWASHATRNTAWFHMDNGDVISMPDTWEYPWYATWDLAFHAVALSLVDPAFAKSQLELMLRQRYLHPSGQVPAYEWDFGDVNPPVHAWATLVVYRADAAMTGKPDRDFLERIFNKLLMNFTWWVNRKDPRGRNVFEGGFLGLDNIGVFDRSHALPTGGHLEQADGTAWMAFFCQSMLAITLELGRGDPDYEELAFKFAEHFLWIRAAMDRVGAESMWDDEDGFFYDVMRLPDGSATRLKVRSLVGLLPLAASTIFEPTDEERFPQLLSRLGELVDRHPALAASTPRRIGVHGRRILSILHEEQLRRVLAYMLDENEFLSPYGIRSVSRVHREHPYTIWAGGAEYRVDYEPAESSTRMFGGNSNWRGPIWFPVNFLLLRALLHLYELYGDDFRVECPTGSGQQLTLYEVAHLIAARLASIFLRDESGRRPVFGGVEVFQSDPHWRDNLLFFEYFHGDNGAGLGASHQTGWTGLAAFILQQLGRLDAHELLEQGIGALFERQDELVGAR